MRVRPNFRPISAKVPPLSHSRKISSRRSRCASLGLGFFSVESETLSLAAGLAAGKTFGLEVWDKDEAPLLADAAVILMGSLCKSTVTAYGAFVFECCEKRQPITNVKDF